MRVLAYTSSFDAIDENLEMAAPTVSACVEHFCEAVIAVFGEEYTRPPRRDEMLRLLEQNERRGFPGMVGSICIGFEKIALWRLLDSIKEKKKSQQRF